MTPYGALRIDDNGQEPGSACVFDLNVRCAGDIDGDGTIGITDFLVLLSAWGPCPACPADLDGDGSVGYADLAILFANWE